MSSSISIWARTGLLGALLTAGAAGNALAHPCEGKQGMWQSAQIDAGLEAKIRTEYAACTEGTAGSLRDSAACRNFVGKVLDVGWNASDFREGDGYMLPSKIARELSGGGFVAWQSIGTAAEQGALEQAAELAAAGQPVLAVYADGSQSHVSVILPGGVAPSGSWSARVPRAAHLSLDERSNTFMGCRLSYAYGAEKKAGVTFYAKAAGVPMEETAVEELPAAPMEEPTEN